MKDFVIYILGAVFSLSLIAAGYFLVERSGLSILRTRRHIKRIREALEPITQRFGVRTSIEWHSVRGLYLYKLLFVDKNFLTLEVWLDRFNIFIPNWTQGNEKHTEGYAEVLAEIGKLPGGPPNAG